MYVHFALAILLFAKCAPPTRAAGDSWRTERDNLRRILRFSTVIQPMLTHWLHELSVGRTHSGNFTLFTDEHMRRQIDEILAELRGWAVDTFVARRYERDGAYLAECILTQRISKSVVYDCSVLFSARRMLDFFNFTQAEIAQADEVINAFRNAPIQEISERVAQIVRSDFFLRQAFVAIKNLRFKIRQLDAHPHIRVCAASACTRKVIRGRKCSREEIDMKNKFGGRRLRRRLGSFLKKCSVLLSGRNSTVGAPATATARPAVDFAAAGPSGLSRSRGAIPKNSRFTRRTSSSSSSSNSDASASAPLLARRQRNRRAETKKQPQRQAQPQQQQALPHPTQRCFPFAEAVPQNPTLNYENELHLLRRAASSVLKWLNIVHKINFSPSRVNTLGDALAECIDGKLSAQVSGILRPFRAHCTSRAYDELVCHTFHMECLRKALHFVLRNYNAHASNPLREMCRARLSAESFAMDVALVDEAERLRKAIPLARQVGEWLENRCANINSRLQERLAQVHIRVHFVVENACGLAIVEDAPPPVADDERPRSANSSTQK